MRTRQVIAMTAIAMMMTTMTAAGTGNPLCESNDRLHRMIWARMVEPSTGVLFDYTGTDGKVEIPTPEDCRSGRPNAISWWTPIENGAFFNGLYLAALCDRWESGREEEIRVKVCKLVAGLLLLQEVGQRPGFIARGVSTDGRTHYPIGSDDQTFPWFFGLWKYLRSGIPDAAERQAVTARMDTVARAVKDCRWCMPCEAPYTIRGGWSAPHFVQAVRLVFVNRIMRELTGDEFWRRSCDEVSAHRFADGRSRMDLIAAGDAGMRAEQTWIHASSAAALRELLRLETDPARQQLYRDGLHRTGAAAAPHLGGYVKFDPAAPGAFTPDWRVMNRLYRPQPTVRAAVDLAHAQIPVWNAASPAIVAEKRHVMLPLFAAWIVLLSGDRALIEAERPRIEAMLLHYPWEKLHYSACFAGENVYGELTALRSSRR